MNRSKIIILLFLLATSIQIYSQNPQWLYFTNKKTILSLAKEGDYLWVGTSAGLVKLNTVDGRTIFFNKTNSVLPENTINAIAIDSSGNKWFGTNYGLVKYDGINWNVLNTSNSGLPSNKITTITIENNDVIWFGTDGGGLAKFDGTNWTVFNTNNTEFGLPGNEIWTLEIDNKGIKWIGTNYGMASYSETQWFTHYNTGNTPIPSNYISSIAIDDSQNIWIGTDGSGLAKFNGSSWKIYNVTNSPLPSKYITALAADNSDNIWIGTQGGLVKFDGLNWIIYNKLPFKSILSFLIDNNLKWVGSDGEGLVKFDEKNYTFYNTSNYPLPDNRITNIYIDSKDTKWIGTSYIHDYSWPYLDGLTRIDSSNWVVITENGIMGHINDMVIDKNNNLWLGALFGLTRYDPSNFTINIVLALGDSIDGIKTVEIDNFGNLWVAGIGIGKYDGINWSIDHTKNIEDLAFDKNGNLWASSSGMRYGKLWKFDGNYWIDYWVPGYPDVGSRYLAIDSIGNIWATTYGGGLAKFNGTNWTSYNASNSDIPNNYPEHIIILQIFPLDISHMLYISIT